MVLRWLARIPGGEGGGRPGWRGGEGSEGGGQGSWGVGAAAVGRAWWSDRPSLGQEGSEAIMAYRPRGQACA